MTALGTGTAAADASLPWESAAIAAERSKKMTTENVGGSSPAHTEVVVLVVPPAAFSDLESETRVTPSTALSRASIRATPTWLEAQPVIVIAGAWIDAAERVAPGTLGAGQAHVAVERREPDVGGQRAGEVAQRLLPVEPRRGQAADGLDAGRGQRLEVGVRLQRRDPLGRDGAAILGGLEIGLALLDRVGGQDVAASATTHSARAPSTRNAPMPSALS